MLLLHLLVDIFHLSFYIIATHKLQLCMFVLLVLEHSDHKRNIKSANICPFIQWRMILLFCINVSFLECIIREMHN